MTAFIENDMNHHISGWFFLRRHWQILHITYTRTSSDLSWKSTVQNTIGRQCCFCELGISVVIKTNKWTLRVCTNEDSQWTILHVIKSHRLDRPTGREIDELEIPDKSRVLSTNNEDAEQRQTSSIWFGDHTFFTCGDLRGTKKKDTVKIRFVSGSDEYVVRNTYQIEKRQFGKMTCMSSKSTYKFEKYLLMNLFFEIIFRNYYAKKKPCTHRRKSSCWRICSTYLFVERTSMTNLKILLIFLLMKKISSWQNCCNTNLTQLFVEK